MNSEPRTHQTTPQGSVPAAPVNKAAGEGARESLDALHDSAGNAAVNTLLARPPAGTPLDDPTRRRMEGVFAADLGAVRLHDDGAAQQAGAKLGTAAFTHGENVFLGPQAPELSSTTGQWLLAHELTHVLQQRQAPAAVNGVGPRGDAHELAADRAAGAALAGNRVSVAPAGAVPAVQRAPIDLKTATERAAAKVAKQTMVSSTVRAFLERVWTKQSDKQKPLRMDDDIREGLKLVFSETPAGVSTVASALQHDPGTTEALMTQIEDKLPATIPPEAQALLNKLPGPKTEKEPAITGPSPAKGDEAAEAALKEAARRLLATEAGQQLAKSTKQFVLSKQGIPLVAIVAGGAITFVAANDPKLPAIPEIELGEGIKIKIEYSGRISDLPPLVRQMVGMQPTAGSLPTPKEYSQFTGQPDPKGPDEVKVGVSVTMTNEGLVTFLKAVGSFFAVVGRGIGKGVVAVGKVIWPYLAAAMGGAVLGALIGLAVGGGIGAAIGAAVGAGAALLLFGVGKLVQYFTDKKKKKSGDE